MRNADQAAIVFAAFKKLEEATEAFSKGGITSVAHSYERGEALGKGLVALAQYHDVPIKGPLHIDSRGDFRIIVDQMSDKPCIKSAFNGNKVYGKSFSALLNEFNPRTGDGSGKNTAHEEDSCYLNHFAAEKMLVKGAKIIWEEVYDEIHPDKSVAGATAALSAAGASAALAPGQQVVTVNGELNTDDDGQERQTPAGAVGVLDAPSAPGQWSVHFGDAAVHITEDEMRDPEQYRLVDRPRG